MAGVLLFCVAEEAKTITRQACETGHFYLVERRAGVPYQQELPRIPRENPAFESEFIGASLQECQTWLEGRARHDRAVTGKLLAVADARGAATGTVLLQFYASRNFPFGRYGRLPARLNAWYEFRVRVDGAGDVIAGLTEVLPRASYPLYFGNAARLTNAEGIFDVEEANRLCDEEDSEVYGDIGPVVGWGP